MTSILANESVPQLEKQWGLIPLSLDLCRGGQPHRVLARARYLRTVTLFNLLCTYPDDTHAHKAVVLVCNFYEQATWWVTTPNTHMVLERAVRTVCSLTFKRSERCSDTS